MDDYEGNTSKAGFGVSMGRLGLCACQPSAGQASDGAELSITDPWNPENKCINECVYINIYTHTYTITDT